MRFKDRKINNIQLDKRQILSKLRDRQVSNTIKIFYHLIYFVHKPIIALLYQNDTHKLHLKYNYIVHTRYILFTNKIFKGFMDRQNLYNL